MYPAIKAESMNFSLASLVLEDRKLHPRMAAGLAPLMHLQLRAVEKTGLEQRLANWNDSCGSYSEGIGSLVTNSIQKRLGDTKPSSQSAMKTPESLLNHGLPAPKPQVWGLPVRPRLGTIEGD
jgi:hypothetical protein